MDPNRLTECWVLRKCLESGNGTKNRIEPQPQPHQRHMRWPQLINSLNASVKRETERGERGRENPNQRGIRDGERTWPYRKICPWNSIPFLRFFFSEGCCIVCVVSLPLSLSFSILFWLSFFFGSCYYWCCLVSLFSFCLLLLQGFSAVLFKYLLTCTEKNIWEKLKNFSVYL